ncbi:MAG TPA: diacylglycerol kinase family protein [Gemmatimonadales bacterium]
MPRVLLIHNPVASRTEPETVRTVSAVWERAGWSVDVAATAHNGHAAELARQGVADKVDVVAVYGGDGTTMHAVSGLVGSDVTIGLIPGGTGNLLAGNLRVPRDPARAAQVIIKGNSRAIDLGRVEWDSTVRYFAVNCGAGFAGDLMRATTGEAKRRWGVGAYVLRAWSTIGDTPRAHYRITVDGTPVEVDASLVMVLNCGEMFPPYFRMRDGIAVDDGILDVVAYSWNGFLDSIGLLWNVFRGTEQQRVVYARGRKIRVDADQSRELQIDGDPVGTTPFTAEIVPGAVRVLVPNGD